MNDPQSLQRSTYSQVQRRSTHRPLLAVLIAAILGGCASFTAHAPDDKKGTQATRTDALTKAFQQHDSVASRSGGVVKTVGDRWRPAVPEGDLDLDGVLDQVDDCRATASHVTVDRHGCGLFDAVLEDVTFKSGSRWLSPRARGQLDHVAGTLLAFPESRVQVRAHTDAKGAADMNFALSLQRAEAVVQYLQSRGVNERQLQSAGMGETQPLDSNISADGRRRNRRVDLVTLPDLGTSQLQVASSVGSARIIFISDAGQSEPGIDGEPGLQAAKPADEATASTSSTELSIPSVAQVLMKSPSVQSLPVPGVAPGRAISGIVEGLVFPTGESVLTAAAQDALQSLIVVLKANEAVSIAVMAHTDGSGTAEANLALSRERADVVVGHLAESGIDESRLKPEGYGELLPVVQNVTEGDRLRNRRIEIRVLPEDEK